MSSFVEQTIVDFLFKFPGIKEYFLKFNSDEWHQVLSTTLAYGIQAIDAAQNKWGSVPELNHKPKKVQEAHKIDDYIPSLKQKLGTLRKEISELEERLESKPASLRVSEELPADTTYQPQNKPKMVDFWYQTNLRKKSSRHESKPSPGHKPWVHDYSKLVKNQKSSLNYEDLEN